MLNKTMFNSFRTIFFWAAVFTASLLTLSNLGVFLDPYTWPFVGVLTLAFPILFAVTAMFFFVWLFISPARSLLFAIAIILSIPSLLNSFALNEARPFKNTKPTASLRIITWNVGLLNLSAKDDATAEARNKDIFLKIKQLNADVICLQEFFTAVVPGTRYNFLDSIASTLGYPYYYFSKDNSYFSNQYYSGNVIYSKHKIFQSAATSFGNSKTGSLLKTTLLVKADTVHIFTARLQSVDFKTNEYQAINNLKRVSDPKLKGTKNLVRKLKFAFAERSNQVQIIRRELGQTKGPVIFTGDMNDVPTGYAYAYLKKNMKDAWINKGFGVGRTFKHISPSLRIDYIFFSRQLQCIQTTRVISSGSDHYGLVADLQIKKSSE